VAEVVTRSRKAGFIPSTELFDMKKMENTKIISSYETMSADSEGRTDIQHDSQNICTMSNL
jgi:hypothetical protein